MNTSESRNKLLLLVKQLALIFLFIVFTSNCFEITNLRAPLKLKWKQSPQKMEGKRSHEIPKMHGSGLKNVVVIGSGIGGLATAGRLAKAGFKVQVFEKNPMSAVGGRMNEKVVQKENDYYRFETGPSLMLLPDVYEETFQALGSRLNKFANITRVSPSYSVFFEDGTKVVLCDDNALMKEQLESIEPGSYENYKKYLEIAQTNLDVGLPNFIRQKITLEGFDKFLSNMFSAFPLENHYKQLCRFFKSSKLRALVSFQDLYVGLSPYEAPAVFSLLQAIELNQGIYYPLGGFHQIAQGLMSLCEELDVTFHFGKQVEKVLVENGKATGIELSAGETVFADVVVSNADLAYTEEALIPQDAARNYEQAQYSSSVVAFYWALDRRYTQLSHHSVFLTEDYEESWKAIFTHNRMPGKGNFYVHAPARSDDSVCPEGHDAIMVLVPCPHLRTYDTNPQFVANEMNILKEQAKAMVLNQFAQAGMVDFESHILSESTYTPSEWKTRYNLQFGAVFGLSHGLNQLSIFRPSAQHPKIDGLYFTGASTRPGNGVPLVMIGAEQVCENIIERRSRN